MAFWYHIIIKGNSFSVSSTSCLKLKYKLFGKNLLFYRKDILNKSMSLYIYYLQRDTNERTKTYMSYSELPK